MFPCFYILANIVIRDDCFYILADIVMGYDLCKVHINIYEPLIAFLIVVLYYRYNVKYTTSLSILSVYVNYVLNYSLYNNMCTYIPEPDPYLIGNVCYMLR